MALSLERKRENSMKTKWVPCELLYGISMETFSMVISREQKM